MKSLYQKISIACIVLFITGMIAIACFQYTTSDRVASALHISDPAQVQQIRQAVNETAIITGLEIAVGLVAILLLVYQQQLNGTSAHQQENEQIGHSAVAGPSEQHVQDYQVRVQPVETLLGHSFPKPNLFFEKVLSVVCDELEASQAAIYAATSNESKRVIRLLTGYALSLPESSTVVYEFGEGLAGQVAKEGKSVNIRNVPEGYITVLSGLGNASPNALVIVPVWFNDQVAGVLEVASFREFSQEDQSYLQAVAGLLGERLHEQAEKEVVVWQE
jgi:GAF domain-containing protein